MVKLSGWVGGRMHLNAGQEGWFILICLRNMKKYNKEKVISHKGLMDEGNQRKRREK